MELPNGQKVKADSQNYYLSKYASREVAASNVIKAIGPIPTGIGAMAQSLTVSNASISTGKLLIHKEQLNDTLQVYFETLLPDYVTTRIGEQLFQCTISHHLFGSISGFPCKSKCDAEDSAAELALNHLEKWML